jgi:hypothetical protein
MWSLVHKNSYRGRGTIRSRGGRILMIRVGDTVKVINKTSKVYNRKFKVTQVGNGGLCLLISGVEVGFAIEEVSKDYKEQVIFS